MSELYLILHKVRGEPAFDIAQKIMIGDEEGWIIPTSGHRAYPIQWSLLNSPMVENHPAWDDLPDHYTVDRQKVHHTAGRLLKLLGLGRSKSNLGVRPL